MNSSRARLILMFIAPAVLGTGVTACSQGANPPPQTPVVTTEIPSPESTPHTSTGTALTTPNPQSVPPAPIDVSALTVTPEIPSRGCVPEQRWGTSPKADSNAMSPSALYLTRVGRHACYDRVVFDINGPEPLGFVARYVPVVSADASGRPVPVAGRAALEVTVRAPILGADNQGHQPWRSTPTVGESLVAPSQISGWRSLRAVTFAGSFEGQTTVAVGVRERLPFRVSMTSGRGHQHVVLDIAH